MKPLAALFSFPLFRHEARVLGLSPGTPIFLAFAWMFAAGLAFWAGNFFASNRASLDVFLGYVPWVYALVIPALGMASWAEDWRRGVAERLLTLPLTVGQLVGTRLAVMALAVGVFLLGTWPMVATIALLGDPDWGPILTGYLGAWLLGVVFAAFALAAAAMCRSQVVAFIGGFAVVLFLVLSGWAGVVDVLEGWLPAGMVAVMRESSLLEHYRRFVLGVVDARSVLYLLGLLLLAVGWQVAAVAHRAERRPRGLAPWMVIAVAGVAAAAVWAVSPYVRLRLDATADGLYTLSPASLKLVRALPKPVEFVVYDSRTNPDVPLASRLVSRRLMDLLADVKAENPSMVTVRVINPDLNVNDELAAQARGIVEQPLGTGQGFYLGMAASMDGRNAVVPAFDVDRAPYLEFDLMSVLAEVEKVRRKQMTLLSVPNLRMKDLRPTWLTEIESFYDIKYLLPGQPVVPDGTDILVVLMAPYLPAESLYAIDQYVVKGGRVLMLLDPYFRSAPGEDNNLPDRNADAFAFDHPADLLRGWGVEYDGMDIVGDPVLAATINEPELGFRTYPFWLHLTPDEVNHKLPFTSYVDDLLLPEAGSFEPKALASGLTYEPVLVTTDKAQKVPREVFDNVDPQLYASRMAGTPRRYDVAMVLRGRFASLFKDVPPAVANYYHDYAPQGASATVPPLVSVGGKDGAVVAVGDTDFLDTKFSLQPGGRQGELEPVNDNLVFFFNTLQYLAGEGELLGLRGKAVNSRSFVLVEQMLNALGARYVALEQKMAADLFQVSERLQALKAQKEQGLAADPRLEKDLKVFEARNLELRKQLREVRKNLRRDVVRLERVVVVFNLVAMPGLLLGLCVWLRRRRRARAKG